MLKKLPMILYLTTGNGNGVQVLHLYSITITNRNSAPESVLGWGSGVGRAAVGRRGAGEGQAGGRARTREEGETILNISHFW